MLPFLRFKHPRNNRKWSTNCQNRLKKSKDLKKSKIEPSQNLKFCKKHLKPKRSKISNYKKLTQRLPQNQFKKRFQSQRLNFHPRR